MKPSLRHNWVVHKCCKQSPDLKTMKEILIINQLTTDAKSESYKLNQDFDFTNSYS